MSTSTIAVESVAFKPISSFAPNSPVYVERVAATPVVVATPQVVSAPVVTEKVAIVERVAVTERESDDCGSRSKRGGCNWWVILLVFLFVTIFAFFLLYSLNPTAVQNVDANGQPNGTVSVGKCIFGAIIIGIIVAILFWAFASSQRF
jgi:Na+/proline symporter